MNTRMPHRSGALPDHPRSATAPGFLFTGRLAALAAACILAAGPPGCVTETKTRPKGLTRASEPLTSPSKATTSSSSSRSVSGGGGGGGGGGAGGESVQMPDGPVAKPAESADVTDARVTVALRPVGQVPYDGMTLPLISPGGGYLASQSGTSPTWDAVLAQPGGFVGASTRIGAFQIPGDHELANPSGRAAVRAISWPKPLPAGLLLGRSCDDRGFLVESPRPDGARWIGKVSWVSGDLTWLVQDNAVNAFATFGPRGELIFSRRAVASGAEGRFELVIRPNAASAANEAVARGLSRGESFVFPVCGSDPDHVYALAFPGNGEGTLIIVAIALTSTGQERPGTVVARDSLNVEGTLLAACQAAAPMQTPWPAIPRSGGNTNLGPDGLPTQSGGGGGEAGAAVVSASSRSVVWFSPRSGVSALSAGTAAGVPLVVSTKSGHVTVGMLLATERELVFQQMRTGDSSAPGTGLWSRPTPVLAGAYIPRLASGVRPQGRPGVDNPSEGENTEITQMRYVLMNPPKGGSSQVLGISIMVPLPPEGGDSENDR